MASVHAPDVQSRTKTKEYIRPMPATWFLHNRHLMIYALRELTSFFVAGYAIFLILVLARANQGQGQFGTFFREVLQTRTSLILHLIALAFVAFHSMTSFNALGRLTVIRRGEERVSPVLIAEIFYGVWFVLSLLILLGAISYK
jgi:fumarate reductase subunit C